MRLDLIGMLLRLEIASYEPGVLLGHLPKQTPTTQALLKTNLANIVFSCINFAGNF